MQSSQGRPTGVPTHGRDLDRLLAEAASTIGRRIDRIFDSVETLRLRVADIGERAAERHRTIDRTTLSAIRPTIQQLLTQDEPLVEDIGVAVGPNVLSDTPRWLDWWRRDQSGESQFIRHELNPATVGFYDYQAREWFRTPIEQGRSLAVGPYLDFGGIEVYTVTLAAPLRMASGGACLIGADLSMAVLEALLLHSLGTRRHQVILLAPNDRVIASNSAHHVTGSRFRLAAGERIYQTTRIDSVQPQRMPWQAVAVGRG